MIGVAMAVPFIGLAACLMAIAVGLVFTRNWPS